MCRIFGKLLGVELLMNPMGTTFVIKSLKLGLYICIHQNFWKYSIVSIRTLANLTQMNTTLIAYATAMAYLALTPSLNQTLPADP